MAETGLPSRDQYAPADDSARRAVASRVAAPELPAWPVIFLFAPFPLWWLTGLVDLIWIPTGLVMAMYLAVRPGVRVPRGFGVWLAFLLLAVCSATQLSSAGQLMTFTYRFALYVSGSVLFVYVYNARQRLPARRVLGLLTAYFVSVVAGGLLGVLHPYGALRTPMYEFLARLSPGLVSNDLVNHMVVRHFSQYSADSYLGIAPRPTAPFLFTNNWGNAYSMLVPLVLVFLIARRRRGGRIWHIALLLIISTVPAFLTLNRGMFIGLGIVGLWVAVRMALRRDFRGIAAVVALGLLGGVVWTLLPVQERLETRLEGDSTSTRASLYEQSLRSVPGSPILGYGAPLEPDNPNAPPVGTQGQFWLVLVSHGLPAVLCFVGFFLLIVARSRRRRDLLGLTANGVLLASVIEMLYYGVLPYGLPLMMVVAALLMRPVDDSISPPRRAATAAP